MRTSRLLAAVGGILALIVLVALTTGPGYGPSLPRTPVDRAAAPPAAAALPAGTDVVAWARERAAEADIPARTLQAYASAELRQRERTPRCGLSWTTLAGVGRIESRHATFRGAEPGPGGRADPPIIGIALDGTNGTRRVADTDGGRLDGDPVLDRAVGPMQFLPATWARYGADGDGDGVADPQQVDDAALAAAGYLCASGRDVADADDWWRGVLAYNASGDYARDVWSAAADYAQRTAAPAAP
ncbi:lytic transglycosylase domain-containing protein [Pseudonocardia spirodelae]|uniref:Lytic transglycosylase domain-containing protein n=1 Tax=Pseudonocardia spirodelae TaxID=3133431 RepID=A0ABU8TAJ4_9PSEU